MAYQFISKIEAAERQLIEAIHLFYERRDPIAIHTIVGAAHQILLDLAENQIDYKGLMKDESFIREEKRSEYFKKINECKNFFKHSKADPKKKLKFNTELNEFWIVDSIEIHKKLTGKTVYEFALFVSWFSFKRPYLLNESIRMKIEQTPLRMETVEDYESMREFLTDSKIKKETLEAINALKNNRR